MQYNLIKPVFEKGGAIGMSAIAKWNRKTYLKRKFNNVLVPLEVYKSDSDMETSKAELKQVKFNNYLDHMKDNWYVADCVLDDLSVSEDVFEDLFNPQRPEEPITHSLYIGNNTKSGCHLHVEDDVALHQIVGQKIVYLLDYDQLTLKNIFSKRANFSKENFFDLTDDKYEIQKIVLNPGDILFIPPWTWHAVENVGYSIAVTKTFEREKSYLDKKRYKKLKRRNTFMKIMNYILN